MRFACSFTRQRRFKNWTRIILKTGFKEQVFENATIIVSVRAVQIIKWDDHAHLVSKSGSVISS